MATTFTITCYGETKTYTEVSPPNGALGACNAFVEQRRKNIGFRRKGQKMIREFETVCRNV